MEYTVVAMIACIKQHCREELFVVVEMPGVRGSFEYLGILLSSNGGSFLLDLLILLALAGFVEYRCVNRVRVGSALSLQTGKNIM